MRAAYASSACVQHVHGSFMACPWHVQVQLDDGMCKQAVPEEEISDEVRGLRVRVRVRVRLRVRVRVRVTNPDPDPNQVRMSWLLGGWVGKAAGNRTAAK